MCHPKIVLPIFCQQTEESIIYTCLCKRRVARTHDEKNDGESKQIYHISLVVLFGKNLRRHVSGSAYLGSVETWAIAPCEWASKAKIYQFDIVILIKKDIFRLEVPVRESFLMQVSEANQQLLEEVSADRLRKRATVSDIIKNFTARDQLLHDIGYILLRAIRLRQSCWLFEFEIAHNVWMLEVCCWVELLLQ